MAKNDGIRTVNPSDPVARAAALYDRMRTVFDKISEEKLSTKTPRELDTLKVLDDAAGDFANLEAELTSYRNKFGSGPLSKAYGAQLLAKIIAIENKVSNVFEQYEH